MSNEWYCVKDRLPPPNTTVLFVGLNYYDRPYAIQRGHYISGTDWYSDIIGSVVAETVTHWCPMPHLPPIEEMRNV